MNNATAVHMSIDLLPVKFAAAAYEAASKYPHIQIKGVQMHIGSQLTSVAPFVEAVKKVGPFAAELKAKYGISYFSIGGGMGIIYRDALSSGEQAWWDAQPADQRPLTPETYGSALVPLLMRNDCWVLMKRIFSVPASLSFTATICCRLD